MGQARMSNWTTQDAERHLRQSCRVMARLIVEHGSCPLADREFRPFQTLANSIISQQLSAKAADTIERRVQAIVPGFTPAEFLAVQPEALRAAGLSSAKAKHSAIDGRTQRHEGYKVSLKVRKRIEEAFGWIKTVGGLAKTKLIGHAKLAGQALMCFAAYNLVRMGSIGGWWDAHHA